MSGKHLWPRLWIAGIGLLALQALLTYGLGRDEVLPTPPALKDFPRALGNWDRSRDHVLQPEVLQMLQPDDVVSRSFDTSWPAEQVQLFIAYYGSQHRAHLAHDPKVCLPGAGWKPKSSEVVKLGSVEANYYLIVKGETQAVVVYWYQTHSGSVAHQSWRNARRILDTLGNRRTDMALVRIIAAVEGTDVAEARERATRFARLVEPHLLPYFPALPASSSP